MKKRRPTARDREIADAIRGLMPGRYAVTVEVQGDSGLQFLGLARLKTEGSFQIELAGVNADRIVHFVRAA